MELTKEQREAMELFGITDMEELFTPVLPIPYCPTGLREEQVTVTTNYYPKTSIGK